VNTKWKWFLSFRSFKVTDFGTNRKPICDFLLVINTNLHPISHCFEVIADHWSNLHFWGPLWGLGATYDVHLRLIGKLPISHNWSFFARCFHFVTIHAFDRQMDGQTDVDSNTVRICFAYSHGKTGLRWQKVCCNICLCENCQRHSCKAFTSLSICAEMVGGRYPLLREILGQNDPPSFKNSDFHSIFAHSDCIVTKRNNCL